MRRAARPSRGPAQASGSRWRIASYRQTPLATETFRLSTAPAIGMLHQLVAGLARELAHALALGAQHQRQRAPSGRLW